MDGKDLKLLRVARGGDRVYKEECTYCFSTPVNSVGGLYVSLSSFLGFCKDHLSIHFTKTQEPVYLHIVHTVKPPETPPTSSEDVKKPTRLAIGVEGGFDGGQQKIEINETLSVTIMPELNSVPWPCDQLPLQVQDSVKGVLMAFTASKQETISAWDGEKRLVSKYTSDLLQLNNGVKIPPSGWKCMYCDLTSNLWMNLTDGAVLCGRKFFDGSGGNNHAVQHYEDTKYPLAVKLGTITPDGADVYSYKEDDMIEDPYLAKHLSHFGIDITSMTKTDVTMTELQIDINMRIGEWNIIQESGKALTPCYGPGYTGMVNLGNSCYLNSVMQIMFTLPSFKTRYYDRAAEIFQLSPPNAVNEFEVQMGKLAVGLLSGTYSQAPETSSVGDGKQPPQEKKGISPMMFKSLIGRGHPEFSTMRQQDAQEFFLYLLSVIDKNQRSCPVGGASNPVGGASNPVGGVSNPVDSFRFQLEDRVECVLSSKVCYSQRNDFILQLPVPMDEATNKNEVEIWEAKKRDLEGNKQRINPDNIVRAKVPFTKCLERFGEASEIKDFYSSALQRKSLAKKTVRFVTFPEYLMVQMSKFSFGEDWIPKKYDVLIDVPNTLDISHLKGCGLQPGEVELPDDSSPPQPVEVDEDTVMQLTSMGFNLEGCKRAVYHTHNQGVEPAMNWILEHMGDPDFSSTFVPPSQTKATPTGQDPPEEAVVMVTSMGFTRDQAIKALKATDNSVERAVDWVFSHASELDSEEMDVEHLPAPTYRDGSGCYELIGFISHMGTSTMCGHYVCHIIKDGKWVIYNDDKVALSEAPPMKLGYLYCYKRMN